MEVDGEVGLNHAARQAAIPRRVQRLTRPDASEYMQKRIPNAELIMLTPGNHQALLERHQQVNEAARQFIGKLS